MQRTALSPESIHEAEERRREREEKRFVQFATLGLLFFFPPFFIAPYIFGSLRIKDYTKIPVKKVLDKRRLWRLTFLITSYALSYYLIFPFYANLGKNIFPFWKPFVSYPLSEFFVYPHFSLYENLYLFTLYGLIVPIIIAIPLAVVLKKKYRLRIPPDSLGDPHETGKHNHREIQHGNYGCGCPRF